MKICVEAVLGTSGKEARLAIVSGSLHVISNVISVNLLQAEHLLLSTK